MIQSEKISVVVPVYKAEPYLDRCIQSIVDQTYRNLEIILVDDGSPDNCPAMCDAWAVKDSRIRVIHQENTGGAQARNKALDFAQGDLIAFVDSDDYIAPDMYVHLVELLKKGYDIAECNYMEVWNSTAEFEQPADLHLWYYSPEEALKANIEDTCFRQLIWNKLYRRNVIEGVRFVSGKKIDDEFFTYRVLGNAKKLIRSNKVCYAYRQQENSVMHSMPIQKRLQALEAKELRHQYIVKHFPNLESESLKNLWFTCLYQGQLAMREQYRKDAVKSLAYIQQIMSTHPLKSAPMKCTVKEGIWLTCTSISLKRTCQLRNHLKIGL